MKLELKPFGKQYRSDQQSDISDVIYTSSGLRITVIAATSMFTNVYLDIHFDDVAGFRLLDEGDLLGYWESSAFSSQLAPKYHIYEILSGGWATGEIVDSGVLSRNELSNPYREWFVNTSNLCMNILSDEEPLIREVKGRAAPLL